MCSTAPGQPTVVFELDLNWLAIPVGWLVRWQTWDEG
jgi:hypothetical protein